MDEKRFDVKEHKRYQLTLKNGEITSIRMSGQEVRNFSRPETENKRPKLYVVKSGSEVIYVGVTSQSIRNRLRYGLKAQVKGHYHGYKWKKLRKVNILIWCFPGRKKKSVETLEAEIVYLFRRKTGKWPKYQTEIHFHRALETVMKLAKTIRKLSTKT